jgi:hypothetical protein
VDAGCSAPVCALPPLSAKPPLRLPYQAGWRAVSHRCSLLAECGRNGSARVTRPLAIAVTNVCVIAGAGETWQWQN